MRIALISDIHGNMVALEAVLADLERERVDKVVCLGDVAMTGPKPREVLAGGHTHEQMVHVFGMRLIVNPGSVGLPRVLRDGDLLWKPLRAEYAMLEAEEGRLHVDLRRTPVAFERLEAMVAESEMPHGERWLEGWR